MLNLAGIAKSTFFYGLHHQDDQNKKDRPLENIIQSIFDKHHKKYGYLRVMYQLKKMGYRINKKKVYRLMKKLGLRAVPKQRLYNSYRGTVGKIAPNIMNQSFETTGPYQKLGTDITQFRNAYGKLYLSPVIDFHTRECLLMISQQILTLLKSRECLIVLSKTVDHRFEEVCCSQIKGINTK